MRIDMACVPKDRSGRLPGDDVPLIVPGAVTGVFDGATDALGKVIDGVPAGRLAALTVARATARLMADAANRHLPAEAIFANLAEALRQQTAGFDLPIPPSTTLALALDLGAEWRFVLLGDSGIRLNGSEVLQRTKIIDDVSTHARVAIFGYFLGGAAQNASGADLDRIEMAARRVIFLGLDHAVLEDALTQEKADNILALTCSAFAGLVPDASVARFLRDGISQQFRYANGADDALCFDTMNGGAPRLGQWIDETRSKSEIQSIELFTDGYCEPPSDVSVAVWEAHQRYAEAVDYHMTGRFRGVKGATTSQFFDDRTVIVLGGLPV